jgi:archaellum biogenesis ATPase FlaH
LYNLIYSISPFLPKETLKVCELQIASIQENVRKQREILAHRYNHAQLQTQENTWMKEMKSLQNKYTRNKIRKLTVLETHKRARFLQMNA